MELNYKQQRVTLDNGRWMDVHIVAFPAAALQFEDLHPRDKYVRQTDIARLRYSQALQRGEEHPHILTWACMQHDRRAHELFPDIQLMTDQGEALISGNSFVTYTLRKLLDEGWLSLTEFVGDYYEWQTSIPEHLPAWQKRADAVLAWLEESILLDFHNPPHGKLKREKFDHFNSKLNLIPVGRCDFVRNFVHSLPRRVVFNTSFFLWEQDELISHHSAAGNPFGLLVQNGTIFRPPLYKRSAIWYEAGKWSIGQIGIEDLDMHLPGDVNLSNDDNPQSDFAVNPAQPAEISLYTRYYGVRSEGRVLGRTPILPGRREITVINRQIVGWKRGGGLVIPQNGFVLSFAEDVISEETFQQIITDTWVEYAFRESRIERAIQAGPLLLKDGAITLDEAVFDHEEFWDSREIDGKYVIGCAPTHFPTDIDQTRTARTGLGIKADGDLVVVAIDGVNMGMETERDSAGATLRELAEQLQAAGAIHALNLSGDGSTQLFYESGLLTRPADRRGRGGVIYERMIPSIGVVS